MATLRIADALLPPIMSTASRNATADGIAGFAGLENDGLQLVNLHGT